jgi:hypothetical protein
MYKLVNNLSGRDPIYKEHNSILSKLITIYMYTFTYLTPLLNHTLSRLRLLLNVSSCRTRIGFVNPSAT